MLDSLPNEIIEQIFEFGIEIPQEILSHSRVCKQFYEILENTKMWENVKLENVSRLRVGFRWSQLISNPIDRVLDTMNGFFDRLKGGYADSKGVSLLSEIRENVNMKEYCKWMKYYRRDKYLKKFLSLGHLL
ncbi:Hypothetical protein NAEGRDRAFT_72432 [Naegleria gruberi]|uniref:F-box domain-containing protein n=1 Tax=Naegleria gruberi TaxID=5762 RepID=D2VTU7_NAEGR|nr:uncharacterized protein NAEGRDRAFT_72432 [Naegleria gruberi]EFC39788.1 Hypothetical protein NAEGRDRAFT_72432 [Naegleria gruberi]|eukprot:XP_002672532.1 Hypothetical protein NAEGRDRAFT_72432 [Naegleria gruberi strain NEG-M]